MMQTKGRDCFILLWYYIKVEERCLKFFIWKVIATLNSQFVSLKGLAFRDTIYQAFCPFLCPSIADEE